MASGYSTLFPRAYSPLITYYFTSAISRAKEHHINSGDNTWRIIILLAAFSLINKARLSYFIPLHQHNAKV